jgi:hypothetical protein
MGSEHDSCQELLSVANELAAGASDSRGRAVAAVLAAGESCVDFARSSLCPTRLASRSLGN